jgi:RNA polymerase sigma factor (sigma-70 family)
LKEKLDLSSSDSVDHFVRSYGDLLFDLCESILKSSMNAELAFRAILKKVRSRNRFQKYSNYERSWVLRIACNRLLTFYHQEDQNTLAPAEDPIKTENQDPSSVKIKNIQPFFRRLRPEDQMILLLRDKYDIPYSEIATALTIPEGSLKIRRQQALRTLEDWLWNSR